jgi:uncharacterized protein YneF (UPF0154 family)
MRIIDIYRRQIDLALVLGSVLGFWFAFALTMKWLLS